MRCYSCVLFYSWGIETKSIFPFDSEKWLGKKPFHCSPCRLCCLRCIAGVKAKQVLCFWCVNLSNVQKEMEYKCRGKFEQNSACKTSIILDCTSPSPFPIQMIPTETWRSCMGIPDGTVHSEQPSTFAQVWWFKKQKLESIWTLLQSKVARQTETGVFVQYVSFCQ